MLQAIDSPIYDENFPESPPEHVFIRPQITEAPLKFNIKITDLSDLENPFVIYEDKKIDENGYIVFDDFDNTG